MTTTSRPRTRQAKKKTATRPAQRIGCSGTQCTEPAVHHVVHVARKGADEVDLWLCESHLERFKQGLYERPRPVAQWLRKARGLLAS